MEDPTVESVADRDRAKALGDRSSSRRAARARTRARRTLLSGAHVPRVRSRSSKTSVSGTDEDGDPRRWPRFASGGADRHRAKANGQRSGDQPILWHIMRGYAAWASLSLLSTVGYKGDVIKNYFLDYFQLHNDFTVRQATAESMSMTATADDWTVHVVDTGIETQTGGRIRRLEPWLRDGRFMLTYGDGVADVPCRDALDFHRSHGQARDGHSRAAAGALRRLIFDGDSSRSSPRSRRSARAGSTAASSCSSPACSTTSTATRPSGSASRWSGSPRDGQVVAYRHDGFWQPMDTLRDVRLLEALWQSGSARGRSGSEASGAGGASLVTGATGMVGSWLVKELLDQAPMSWRSSSTSIRSPSSSAAVI